MPLLPETSAVLKLVEERTGTPVELRDDPSLPVLANVTMARAGVSAHVVRFNPNRSAPDYLITYECGFVLQTSPRDWLRRLALARAEKRPWLGCPGLT